MKRCLNNQKISVDLPSSDRRRQITHQPSVQIPFSEEVKRKLIHLSSLWIPSVMILFARNRMFLFSFFSFLFCATLLVEHARSRNCALITPVYDFFFGRMLREMPKRNSWIISGGAPVFGAAALLMIFPNPIAPCAMTIMLTGDVAAAIIGRIWGIHKFFNGKTLEGSLAFIFVGYAGASFFLYIMDLPVSCYMKLFPVVVLSSIIEFFSEQLHIDDNFSVPIIAASTMSIVFLL